MPSACLNSLVWFVDIRSSFPIFKRHYSACVCDRFMNWSVQIGPQTLPITSSSKGIGLHSCLWVRQPPRGARDVPLAFAAISRWGDSSQWLPNSFASQSQITCASFLFLFLNGNHVMQELGDDVVQTTFDFDPRVFLWRMQFVLPSADCWAGYGWLRICGWRVWWCQYVLTRPFKVW